MEIIISNASDKPIYEQIASQIKGKIMSGELLPGDMLPSMRLLAKELRISVITTKRAYSDLEKEGFIETVTGKGSFIAAQNTNLIKEEQLRQVENYLNQAVEIARVSNIDQEELIELIRILYQGD
ncbi:GntR family transcriptional regulator [Eubacteriaceae bacterium ES2]|nr:GntR family transcriptional regulator [Eubacteriaceae bacterium ES2]